MSYIHRLYHEKSDVDIISDAIDAGKNVLLLGPTGTGKTTMVEQVAIKRKQRLTYVPCHGGGTAEQLLGQMIPNPNFGLPNQPQFVWKDGLITRAVRRGDILLLDEINSLRAEVTFCIHGLLDHRRELILPDFPGDADTVRAAPGFGVIAAGNPDYEGVQVMNTAFRDRFAVQLFVGYSSKLDRVIIQTYEKEKSAAALDPQTVVAVITLMEKIRLAVTRGTLHVDVSTRAFLDLCDNLRTQTVKIARSLFENKFLDDPEQKALISTCFDDLWDKDGNLMNTAPIASQARQPGGRNTRFANPTVPNP